MIFLGTLEGFNLYKDALLLGKKEGKNKNKRMGIWETRNNVQLAN